MIMKGFRVGRVGGMTGGALAGFWRTERRSFPFTPNDILQ